jgi:hypothetical protein
LGLSELQKSAESNGLRASFSTMYLLVYHTFVTPVFGKLPFFPIIKDFAPLGNSDGDLEICQALVTRYLKLYPDVSLIFDRCITLLRVLGKLAIIVRAKSFACAVV